MPARTPDLKKMLLFVFKNRILPRNINEVLDRLNQNGIQINKQRFMGNYQNDIDQFWRDMATLGFKRESNTESKLNDTNNKLEDFDDDDFDIDDFLDSNEFKNRPSSDESAFSDFSFNTSFIRDYQSTSKTSTERSEKLNQIVKVNQRLVEKIACKYKILVKGTCLDFNDLISLGDIGLLTSIEKFEPDKGYQFSTYATWWIRQSISRGIAEESRIIRLPVHLHEKLIKVRLTEQLFENKYGTVDLNKLCKSLKISNEKYWEIQRIIHQFDQLIHIEMSIGEDGNTELKDIMSMEQMIGTEEKLPTHMITPEKAVEKRAMKNEIGKLLALLKPREADVIRLRFGIGGHEPLTLEEVGELYHVTRERIRQIEAKSIRKLRHLSRDKQLKVFIEG